MLVRSWDSQYAVNVMRERALLEAMMQAAPRLVEVYTEEVDGVRFPSGEPPEFVDYLRAKYGGRHTDLVIASGNEPLEFVARHRDGDLARRADPLQRGADRYAAGSRSRRAPRA